MKLTHVFSCVLALSSVVIAADAPSKDPALDPAPVIANPGAAYATRNFQGIPGIERAPKGRLWAVWYGGGDNEGPLNYVMLVTSGDDGRTWSNLQTVVDPNWFVRAYDPVLWTDPQGRMWLFWAQAVGHWDGRGGVWEMHTSNPDSASPKWTRPRRIANGVMMNKPTVDGKRWLLPIAGWKNIRVNVAGFHAEKWAPHTRESLTRDIGAERGSNVYVSTDKGRTFRMLGQAQVPATQFDEHMLIARRDKSLWMLVRTTYGIGQSTSTDGGKTWTPGEKYMDHVVTRFFIRRLNSGRLLLVKHTPPNGKGRSHLTAYLSDDDGKTWRGGLLLDERANVSYPDGVQSKDGRIYIIYDRERTKAREILMAVFTEDDVMAGGAASKTARLRVLINKAGE